MARLYVNKVGIVNEFTNLFIKNLSLAIPALKDDIKSNTSSEIAGLSQKPEVFIALNREIKKVSIDIRSNIAFILDNYGTGSLMSLDNPGLAKYKSSNLWNPDRKGHFITGRKEGSYKNITGKHSSSGRYRGVNLEGRTIRLTKNGKKLRFKPHAPTGALHHAISWFYETWFEECWKKTRKEFNISKYLTFK